VAKQRRQIRHLETRALADPYDRAEWFLRQSDSDPDEPGRAALLQVRIHAGAALRARKAALAALKRDTPAGTLRVLGEGSVAAILLYLTVSAAKIYCRLDNNPGPIGRDRLDHLLHEAEHMRDCVIHWDDKANDTPGGFIGVTNLDLQLVGSGRRRGGRQPIAVISWDDFEDAVTRLDRWAAAVLAEDPSG
jgi:hypothetical protein